MTDPIDPATIARLRELTGWMGNSDDDGEHEEDLDLADWQIRAIYSALRSGAIPIPDDAPQLAAQAAEIEKWKGLSLVAEEITDARISDLLEIDAQAKGHSFSDAAAVFQRKATRLQRECDVIRASRDDLEDERHRLAFKCEQAVNRVGELEAEVERLRAERDEARRFGEEAARRYNAMIAEKRRVTCVYCGHQYKDGTPAAQDAALTEHIKACEKHPMRAAEARVAELEGLLRKHAALACTACMGTGAYLGDEDRDGPCDACGGTGHVMPDDVAAVLAEREGGR